MGRRIGGPGGGSDPGLGKADRFIAVAVIIGAVVAAGGGVGVGTSLGGAGQVVDTAAGKSIRAKKAEARKRPARAMLMRHGGVWGCAPSRRR